MIVLKFFIIIKRSVKVIYKYLKGNHNMRLATEEVLKLNYFFKILF